MTTLPHPAHEDNSPSVLLPLNKGYSAIVDQEDSDLALYRWHVDKNGYAIRQGFLNKRRTSFSLHRIILERKLGRPIHVGMHVDHRNGDIRDNRRENLREVTPTQNAANRRHKNTSCASRYKGVSLNPRGKWQASIHCGGKCYYLGLFETEDMAAKAYDQAAVQLYGEYAGTNEQSIQPTSLDALRRVGQVSSINTSGFRGVSRRGEKWAVCLHIDNKRIYLGVFEDKVEAARAYDRAVIAYRGERACTNFPYGEYESEGQGWTK